MIISSMRRMSTFIRLSEKVLLRAISRKIGRLRCTTTLLAEFVRTFSSRSCVRRRRISCVASLSLAVQMPRISQQLSDTDVCATNCFSSVHIFDGSEIS